LLCSEDTRTTVIEEGGIAAVVSAMQAHKDNSEIQESGHEALSHLMNDDAESDVNATSNLEPKKCSSKKKVTKEVCDCQVACKWAFFYSHEIQQERKRRGPEETSKVLKEKRPRLLWKKSGSGPQAGKEKR